MAFLKPCVNTQNMNINPQVNFNKVILQKLESTWESILFSNTISHTKLHFQGHAGDSAS